MDGGDRPRKETRHGEHHDRKQQLQEIFFFDQHRMCATDSILGQISKSTFFH